MTDVKLSQIASGGAAVPSTDSIVAVRGGTTDVLITLGQPINAQTGASYAIATTDAGQLVTFNNAAAVAVSLVQATTTGYTAGFSFTAQNLGAGAVTITPATSTINGVPVLILHTGESVQITSDGANYQISLSTAGSLIGTTALQIKQALLLPKTRAALGRVKAEIKPGKRIERKSSMCGGFSSKCF